MELVKEVDPYGRSQHESGSKLDSGKIRAALVIGGFASALTEVAKVGTFGADKYTDNGWTSVPDGLNRYNDAKVRHMLQEASGGFFPSTSHRVINPEGADKTKSRISLPLFLHPNPEVVLSEKYTADSYLMERLRELGVI